ncbi:hypothetical protein Tco_1476755, partial [Tanacetum coccineum]
MDKQSLKSVSTRMNKLTGNGEGGVAQTDHVDFANQIKVHNASSITCNDNVKSIDNIHSEFTSKMETLVGYGTSPSTHVKGSNYSTDFGQGDDDSIMATPDGSSPEGDHDRVSSLAGRLS